MSIPMLRFLTLPETLKAKEGIVQLQLLVQMLSYFFFIGLG